MFNQHFGTYLLNKGVISPGQLTAALGAADSAHVKLGVLAINAGYMTPEQVKQVHERQKRVDKRLGELAVELGYLSMIQLEELLATQRRGHLVLGQVLVDRGYLDLEQLETALQQYRAECALDDHPEAHQGSVDCTGKSLHREYLSLLVRNMVRFFGAYPRPEICAGPDPAAEWLVSQRISGQFGLVTALAGQGTVLCELAAQYAEEPFDRFDELAQASVGEFLNMHNGIFLVNLSNQGVELRLEPQVVEAWDGKGMDGAEIVRMHLGRGTIDLMLKDL